MPVFGPIVGVNSEVSSSEVTIPFDCASTVSIGDLVTVSLTVDNTVETVTNNTYSGLVVGYVTDKPSATECLVITTGKIMGFTGLTRGKLLFVSPTGQPTHTPPTVGMLQIIGTATSDTAMMLHIEFNKVVRV